MVGSGLLFCIWLFLSYIYTEFVVKLIILLPSISILRINFSDSVLEIEGDSLTSTDGIKEYTYKIIENNYYLKPRYSVVGLSRFTIEIKGDIYI